MAVIEVSGLTKKYGGVTAVDGLTFAVAPGRVTGFVGANGAGKSTTLRMLLGLTRPTAGTALVNGKQYADLVHPMRTVGAMLDPDVFHPHRTGRNAVRVVARAAGIADRRVDEVLELVGLTDAGRRRAGGYSTGMRQRLALAVALLGDPDILVLDEPANGLDPEGVHWLRGLIRTMAGQGRTILVSSHQLAELAQTADDVVIIAAGRLVAHESMTRLVADAAGASLEEAYLRLTQSDLTTLHHIEDPR